MKDFDTRSVEIGKVLLSELEKNKKFPTGLEKNNKFQITYADLGNMLVPPRGAYTLTKPLCELSDFCEDNSLPLISVVVVRQEDLMPGKGFFKKYFNTENYDEKKKFFSEESKKVYECEDWSPLKRKLGLL